ncbi:hypothetical protein [Catellatospora sp. IY07-71]|uniref:hypothetical protein n=1 Tax=Catellatospora sp. IY07-71 TaxID=2728827 RepID=UPI001BB399D6|nr:hypothetical protein [Catellatospora sp. IY07-71]
MRPLSARVLTVWSPPRETIYHALLVDPSRCWTVAQVAEVAPGVSVEAVRSTLHLLLGDAVMEIVPRQRLLTLRLAPDGADVLGRTIADWEPGHTIGDMSGAKAGQR